MSGLAAVLAGRHEPGIYRWHGAFDVADVRHTVEHAGWRFGHLDGWRAGQGGVPGRGRGCAGFPDYYGQNFDALADCLHDSAPASGHRLLWDGWGPLARADGGPSHVALERAGSRVDAERGVPFAVLLRGEGPDLPTSPPRLRASIPASTDRRPQTARWVAAEASSAQHAARVVVDVGRVQRRERQGGELADDRLDLCVRAGGVDDPAQLARPGPSSGCPARASRRPASSAGGGVERQRDQHRALALDQVVAGGLAGDAGSPNTPSRSSRSWNASPSGSPKPLTARRARRRRRRPARRRCAAAARWSTSPTCSAAPSSRFHVGPARGLHRHVEELAGDHLRAAQVEDVERRRRPAPAGARSGAAARRPS